ncbi:hypothetical protein GALL_437240 [mine drainage metagenome]|uniref:Uncharacterized protein n=1 Tax=mine drainage metagenome TaxID=410659 RepID=A0A1J5PSN6_9ZZZZ
MHEGAGDKPAERVANNDVGSRFTSCYEEGFEFAGVEPGINYLFGLRSLGAET